MRAAICSRDKQKRHAKSTLPLPKTSPLSFTPTSPPPPTSTRTSGGSVTERRRGKSGQKMAADLLNERLPPDWSYGVTGDGRVFFIRWGRIYSMMDSFSSSRRPLARVWRWNLTRIPVIFVVLAFPVSDTERHLGCIQSQDVPFRRDTRLHPVSATPFCLVPSFLRWLQCILRDFGI